MEQPGKILWTVVTTDSKSRSHTYDVPEQFDKIIELIDSHTHHMFQALSGEVHFFQLNNPTVIYNAAQVVSIEFTIVGPDDIKKAVQESQRKMGFKL